MDLLNPYLLATVTIAATLLYLLLQPHPTTTLARWLQKKNYQYEVTFSLYMLTPTEKFVFSKRLPDQYSMVWHVLMLSCDRLDPLPHLESLHDRNHPLPSSACQDNVKSGLLLLCG